MPTPGHTAGSVSVLTDTGELIAGDLVANSFMGLIPGRPANPPFHDDPRGNLASLHQMLALKPTTLHVGHGPALDPGCAAGQSRKNTVCTHSRPEAASPSEPRIRTWPSGE